MMKLMTSSSSSGELLSLAISGTTPLRRREGVTRVYVFHLICLENLVLRVTFVTETEFLESKCSCHLCATTLCHRASFSCWPVKTKIDRALSL